jgi:glycyl-tRNA synthetase
MTTPIVSDLKDMADLVSLCKRRGFVFPSSEVYGGINACWDYGPLGIELKRNVKESWWKSMTDREDIEGLDAAILMHPLCIQYRYLFFPLSIGEMKQKITSK